jgi:UDP-N-acetylmuramyl pentapeptide phosphotransferase/UDP-N-acetylglucosamine-1-phosphate transferase
MSFSLAGSLIAFFYFNVFGKRLKIFLGDAGSLMIGLTISVLVIRFLNYQTISLEYNIHSAPAIAFGILIIPLFDTLRVFTLRLIQRRSPFSADRQHIHHILIDLNLTHFKATVLLLMTNLIIIIISFELQELSNVFISLIQLTIALSLTYIITALLRKKRENKIPNDQEQYAGKQISIMSKNPKNNILNMGKRALKKKRNSII